MLRIIDEAAGIQLLHSSLPSGSLKRVKTKFIASKEYWGCTIKNREISFEKASLFALGTPSFLKKIVFNKMFRRLCLGCNGYRSRAQRHTWWIDGVNHAKQPFPVVAFVLAKRQGFSETLHPHLEDLVLYIVMMGKEGERAPESKGIMFTRTPPSPQYQKCIQ